MPATIYSASLTGIDSIPVEVQCDSTPGLHAFTVVGLADKAVQESVDRIGSALKNSGFLPPMAKNRRFIINLSPADSRKEGPAFDLPIAIAYLSETKQVTLPGRRILLAGEVALDGTLRKINGALSMAIMAKDNGFSEIIVPEDNAREAASIDGVTVIGVTNLRQVACHLSGSDTVSPTVTPNGDTAVTPNGDIFRHIIGQKSAKRALTIAAAGGHNILMHGAPGSGKTLLAKAIIDILPPLSRSEALEVARIYSSIGILGDTLSSRTRPFRNPHHTTSAVAVIGGGTWPKPGEISLSHRGVLFLDELAEFPRSVLESLRQPLEDGIVTISRANGSVTLPAKFMFVAATNPCPCGNWGQEGLSCVCSPISIIRYRKKISGPLLDRMDIQIAVPRETAITDAVDTAGYNDARKAVETARKAQESRYATAGIIANSDLTHANIDTFIRLEPAAEEILQKAIQHHKLSLRAYHKMKKVAQTIADMESSDIVRRTHIAEAITLRLSQGTEL